MSGDEIERLMRKRISDEQERQDVAAQELAQRFAAGAEAARGFMELMRRHNIAPEHVYRITRVQIPGRGWGAFRKPDTKVTRLAPVDKGWVVGYSLDEDRGVSGVEYLRTDEMLRSCGLCGFADDELTDGWITPQSRTAFGTSSVLYHPPYGDHKTRKPLLMVEDYAAAAERYLT